MTAERNGTAGLRQVLAAEPDLIFAVLVGSRADGRARPSSDWDVAVRWSFDLTPMQRIEKTEALRRDLAAALGVPDTMIDVVDLSNATLTMRAVVAEEGLPLCGDDTLHWARFLTATWRELEDFYWSKQHAA